MRAQSIVTASADNIDRHERVYPPAVGYRVLGASDDSLRGEGVAACHLADERHDLCQNAPCGYHSVDPGGAVPQINDT
jgi:hypothetical protein